ncbi:MAG: HEAT repeat domain-containing protein [Planctomycetes bacterium]|nr:HEAT repeat domain-containing protein [Planctomycetota bacterium]
MNLRSTIVCILIATSPCLRGQDIDQVLSEATLLAQVEGERDAALQLLREKLATSSSPEDKTRLEAALRALDVRNESPQDPVPREDPLAKIIWQLDTGPGSNWTNDPQPAHLAFRKLKDLESLCVPSLYAMLDRLGPFGLENAFELLVEFSETEPLVAHMRTMLTSEDFVRRQVAANYLAKIPAEARVALATQTLQGDDERVRLDTIRAIMGLEGQEEVVIEQARRLARSSSSRIVKDTCQALTQASFPDRSVAMAILEDVASRDDAETASHALSCWSYLARGEDGAKAEALWKAHSGTRGAGQLVEKAFQLEDARWAALVEANLMFQRPGRSSEQSPALELLGQWKRIIPAEELRAYLNQPKSPPSRTVAAVAILEYLGQVDHPQAESIAWEILERIPRNASAFNYLADHHPQRLLANAERFLRPDSIFVQHILNVLVRAKAPQTIDLIVNALRTPDGIEFGDLRPIFTHVVSEDDVPSLLRLIEVPAPAWTYTNQPGRSQGSNMWSIVVSLTERTLGQLVSVEHVPLFVEWMDRIPSTTANDLFQKMNWMATQDHLDIILQRLDAVLAHPSLPRPVTTNERERPIGKSEVIQYCVLLLRHCGGDRARARLIELASHPESWIRDLAIGCLPIPNTDSLEITQLAVNTKSPSVRAQAWNMPLAAQDPALRSQMIARLVDPTTEVESKQAAAFLNNLPREGKAEILDDILKRTVNAPTKTKVHVAALEALASLGDPAHILIMARSLASQDNGVRTEAIELVGSMFDPRAVPFLLAGLRDREHSVRTRAKTYLDLYREYFESKGYWDAWLKEHGGK